MITRILLIISIWFNVVLYYWLIDLWQFRNYINSTIELGKQIWTSDEFKQFKNNTKELWKNILDNSQKIKWQQ